MITYQRYRVNNLTQSDNVKPTVFRLYFHFGLLTDGYHSSYNQSQKAKGGINYDNSGIYCRARYSRYR